MHYERDQSSVSSLLCMYAQWQYRCAQCFLCLFRLFHSKGLQLMNSECSAVLVRIELCRRVWQSVVMY